MSCYTLYPVHEVEKGMIVKTCDCNIVFYGFFNFTISNRSLVGWIGQFYVIPSGISSMPMPFSIYTIHPTVNLNNLLLKQCICT